MQKVQTGKASSLWQELFHVFVPTLTGVLMVNSCVECTFAVSHTRTAVLMAVFEVLMGRVVVMVLKGTRNEIF